MLNEVLYAVRLATGAGDATEEQISAAYQPWSSYSGDWDTPFTFRSGLAIDDLPRFAAQLGVPAPANRPDLLRFAVAAGLVITDGDGRYRLAPEQPPVEEVLRLPAEQVALIRQVDARARYTCLAADLASVAVWSPDATVTAPPHELCERLIASEQDIRAAIDWGVENRLLTSHDPGFTALPRPPMNQEVGRPVR